jgi:hypothetical protein
MLIDVQKSPAITIMSGSEGNASRIGIRFYLDRIQDAYH